MLFKASPKLSTAISYCVAGNDLPTIKFCCYWHLDWKDSFWSRHFLIIHNPNNPAKGDEIYGRSFGPIYYIKPKNLTSNIFGSYVPSPRVHLIKAFIEGNWICINVQMCSCNFLSSIQTKKCLCTKAPESKKILWKNFACIPNPRIL